MALPKKSLGQHWLHDTPSLSAVCEAASIEKDDTVLEIGPGLGTLTAQLIKRKAQVVAVEYDQDLAKTLPTRVQSPLLKVIHHDILTFDLSALPAGYKVVANIPYYITSKITQVLLTAPNKPAVAALLVQKEVAERMAAHPGNMSILGVATQYYAEAKLGLVVPAALFTPPPKVDSQIISLIIRKAPLYPDIPEKKFFQVVKAGFGERRKKLRSSLGGGLRLSKDSVDALLKESGLGPDARAQELSLDDWANLTRCVLKQTD